MEQHPSELPFVNEDVSKLVVDMSARTDVFDLDTSPPPGKEEEVAFVIATLNARRDLARRDIDELVDRMKKVSPTWTLAYSWKLIRENHPFITEVLADETNGVNGADARYFLDIAAQAKFSENHEIIERDSTWMQYRGTDRSAQQRMKKRLLQNTVLNKFQTNLRERISRADGISTA